MPLDAQIAALMRRTVSWERAAGKDGFAEESYNAAVNLTCQVEPVERGQTEVIRRADGTEVVPKLRLYFDAADDNAELFTHLDRFTAPDIGGGQKLQPAQINTIYGPDGDPWLVEVIL